MSAAELPYTQIMEAFATYIAEVRPKVESPLDAACIMRPLLRGLKQEQLSVLLLSNKNEVLDRKVIGLGLLDRAHMHPRELFRDAILANCSRMVLVHNHPSGDPTPSAPDISQTKQMVEAGEIIGIEVIDHVILGTKTTVRSKDYCSFREEGLMPE